MFSFLSFDIQLVMNSLIVFIVWKLVVALYYKLDDFKVFLLEFIYKNEAHLVEHGIAMSQGIHSNWHLNEVSTLLIIILVYQQVLIGMSLVNIAQWQSTIEQLVKFHESNPEVPRPKILVEGLDHPSLLGTCLYWNVIFIGLGVVLLYGFDRKITEWIKIQEETESRALRFLSHLPIFLMVYYMTKVTSWIISTCTDGVLELNTALGM